MEIVDKADVASAFVASALFLYGLYYFVMWSIDNKEDDNLDY